MRKKRKATNAAVATFLLYENMERIKMHITPLLICQQGCHSSRLRWT